MAHFRAYPLDDAGKFIGATDFEAADDLEAMQVVQELSGTFAHEVWCGSRYVGRVNCENKVIQLATPPDRSVAV